MYCFLHMNSIMVSLYKEQIHKMCQKGRINITTKSFLLISIILTRCTRGVRVFFSRARMRSSNSARMNKYYFTTE